MTSLNLLITFDYELPLGGITKSFGHSLFSPVEKLLETLKHSNIKAVFFVDILSYLRFRELGITDYTLAFEKQISEILTQGHDIQLHLHPHWLESYYKNGKIIPSSKFKLGDYSNEKGKNSIENIVKRGVETLTELCQKTDATYRCIAYRAGGYNFVPQAGRILKVLYDNGIRYDSSVSRGYFFKSDTSLADYRKIPDMPNWYLSPDGDFSKTAKNTDFIYEVPITSKPKGIFEMPTAFKLKKFAYRAVENRGAMIHSNIKINKVDKIRQLFSSRMLTVDNHTFSPEYLINILDYNLRKFKKHKEIHLALIGHPKSMGKYHYFLLTEFVKLTKQKYGNGIEYVGFKDIDKTLNGQNYGNS